MKKEVKELIDNRDINRLKYIFVDALDVDPTFDNYIEMFNYCKENNIYLLRISYNDIQNIENILNKLIKNIEQKGGKETLVTFPSN